jgi:hypothetical protein
MKCILSLAFVIAAAPLAVADHGAGRNDKQDIRQDRHDLKHDRKELRQDKRTGAWSYDLHKERKDIARDKKDIRQDRQERRSDHRAAHRKN